MATPRNPPRLLRKPVSEKIFRRKIVKGVYLAHDRRFLESVFERDQEGNFRLRQDLNEKEHKRVVALAKQIKKNRGSLKSGRIAALALVIGAVIVFNLLFKNALLTRAGEHALQTAFEARAEIRDLDLRLLSGTLSFSAVTVADRDRPLRNLFEIGPSTLDIDLLELLKGNFVAHTLSVQNIRWNTERAHPGRLERAPAPRDAATHPPPLEGIAIPALSPEDAQAFLMQHFEQLSLPVLIEDAEQRLSEAARELPLRLDANVARLNELSASAERAAAIQVQQIDDIETAITTYRELQSLAEEVQSTVRAAESELNQLSRQATMAVETWDGLTDAVTSDLTYLTDRITDVTADPTAFLMQIVSELLQQRFADLFRYRERAQEIADRLRSGEPGEPRSPFRPGGVDVVYPSVTWPRFYMGLTSVSFGSEESGEFQAGTLRELSSAPRLVGRPTTAELQTLRDGQEHRFDTLLGLHHDSGDLMQLAYRGLNLPLDLQASFGEVSLRELSGPTAFSTTMSLDREGTVRGRADVTISNPTFRLATGVEIIDQIIADAAARSEAIGAQFDYVARGDRITSLSGSTTLDQHVAAGVREYVEQQRAAFEARLRQEANQLAARERSRLEPLHNRVTQLHGEVGDQQQRAQAHRVTVEDQLAAVERRVAELQTAAERRAREQAQRQLERALEDIPRPGIDTERIPRLR